MKWGCESPHLSLGTEAIDLTTLWLKISKSCRDGNERGKSLAVLTIQTWAGLIHTFICREVLFFLARREF